MQTFNILILSALKENILKRGAFLTGISFFVSFVIILPIGLGGEVGSAAPAILWLGVMLASYLTLDLLYQPDIEDGSLEHMIAQGVPLGTIVLAKTCTHWMLTLFPLLLILPIAAAFTNLSFDLWAPILYSFLVGSPALSSLGAFAALLTAGIKRGQLVACILLMPLSLPVLIFALGSLNGQDTEAALKFLGAFSLLNLALCTALGIKALALILD